MKKKKVDSNLRTLKPKKTKNLYQDNNKIYRHFHADFQTYYTMQIRINASISQIGLHMHISMFILGCKVQMFWDVPRSNPTRYYFCWSLFGLGWATVAPSMEPH